MHHMSKGVVGLKLDGVGDAKVENVIVRGLRNTADTARRSWLAVEENPSYKFTGYATRGLSVASSVHVNVNKINVEDMAATMVDPTCLDPLHNFRDVKFDNVRKDEIDAGYDGYR